MQLNYKTHQSLAGFHTFAMPATAAHWFELTHIEQLSELEKHPFFNWQQVQILAGGSNTLFLEDIPLVLYVNLKGRIIEQGLDARCRVTVAAGEPWDEFVAWTLAERCFGLENLSLIPGTVGASPIQNIGAYGVEVSDRLDAVQVYDYKNPQKGPFWIDAEHCGFGYRESRFQGLWSHYLILQVRFHLSQKLAPVLDYAGLRDLMQVSPSAFQIRQRVIQLRQSKLPDPKVVANVGSFFKNPIIDVSQLARLRQEFADIPAYPVAIDDTKQSQCVKVPAAWLLDRLGFKGRWSASFGCYDQQPLVLVHNTSQQASLSVKAAQLQEFIAEIRYHVQHTFQIELHLEPNIIPALSQ